MGRVLFFVHVPKCAGMSLTRALERHLAPDEVYQSTSLIANLRAGRPDFMEIAAPDRLRALIGHWLHQGMLPYLTGDLRFATSLREPGARMRSQYRFDMALRAPGWQPASAEDFLARNRNVLCSFLLAPFPSLRAETGSLLEGAKLVLSGMDTVFDVSEGGAAQAAQAALLAELGVTAPDLRQENVSAGQGAEIGVAEEVLRQAAGDDLALYDWFHDARARQGGGADPLANPVFDPQARARLEALRRRPFQPDTLARYLAAKLARELQVEAADADAVQARLYRRATYADALHRAFVDLRRG